MCVILDPLREVSLSVWPSTVFRGPHEGCGHTDMVIGGGGGIKGEWWRLAKGPIGMSLSAPETGEEVNLVASTNGGDEVCIPGNGCAPAGNMGEGDLPRADGKHVQNMVGGH